MKKKTEEEEEKQRVGHSHLFCICLTHPPARPRPCVDCRSTPSPAVFVSGTFPPGAEEEEIKKQILTHLRAAVRGSILSTATYR